MWHTVFIALHAAAGAIALLAGCASITRRALFGTYLWSLAAMEVFLLAAIAAEWTVLDTGSRVLFAAFAGLGLFMMWRAEQARRMRPGRSPRPSAQYVAHVGFTLVALFDAFIVIAVLNIGAPVWLVIAAGVLVAVAGHFMLRTVRDRIASPPSATRPPPAGLNAGQDQRRSTR